MIPHLNGEILKPTTGSWFMARISSFFRMPIVSGEAAESYTYVSGQSS